MTPQCGMNYLLPEADLRERGRKRVLVDGVGVTISDRSHKANIMRICHPHKKNGAYEMKEQLRQWIVSAMSNYE
jgi:hypothetical protein